MLNSGNNANRGTTTMSSPDVPPPPQCLPLEPITLSTQKYTRSGEVRRVLGVPLGNTAEDISFGVGHLKSTAVAIEELKNFKESVEDATRKARDRAKMLRESIFKLDKYREALSSKKRQQTDLLSNARSRGANSLKMGSQTFQNPNDQPTQRLEDKTKTIGLGLKKRIRTSMVDARADGRSSIVARQQIAVEKDRHMLRASGGGVIQMEEKIRRLPVGGEGWDKKVKRKRSVGAVGNRAINGDQEMKKAMHPKPSADTKFRPLDGYGFRSRSSPGMSGIYKLDESFEPANLSSCTAQRNELESIPPPRDCTTMSEEKTIAKGNTKLGIHENPVGSPCRMIKGKISRTPRTGSVTMADSSPVAHSSSMAHGACDQPTNGTKLPAFGVANNLKRPTPTGSSAHHMTQWVGQRPHKISRMRRVNLVSPVSNNDEAQISSQGFTTSDLSDRTPDGTSSLLLASSVDAKDPKFKMKLGSVPSSVSLSDCVESGGGEKTLKEKGADASEIAINAAHKAGALIYPSRKNKILVKDETGDAMQVQGRTGRFLSSIGGAGAPTSEKIESLSLTKPLQSIRRGSIKNKSKFTRPPSKKLTDRKTSIHAVHVLNSGSSDFTGGSNDDCEELLAAAYSARNASNLACSGPFWKKMDCVFSSVTLQDASYLKQQRKLAEELKEMLSQMFGDEYSALGVLIHKQFPLCSSGRQESHSNQGLVKSDNFCAGFDTGRRFNKVPTMYQRILSALIEEDESEELYHQNDGRNMSFQCASDDSHCGSCNHIDVEPKDRDKMESEVESQVDMQTQKHCLLDRFSCNRSVSSNTNSNRSVSSSLCYNEQWQADDGLSYLDAGLIPGICQNDTGLPNFSEVNVSANSSFDCQYQMLSLDDRLLVELQSIGLHPETMPHLAEGEGINQDIMELQEGLYQQVGKMNRSLEKIDNVVQFGRDMERRNLELVAMNQLIEMAYEKLMACRGTHSSKSVARRVSKHVALDFIKRTLARCRKLEETGRSCFSEPALQDVIFSAAACNNDVKSIDCVGSRTASNRYNETRNHKAEPLDSGTGVVSCTNDRRDSHSGNLHRGSSDAQPVITYSSEQDFFKHNLILNKGRKKEVLLDDVVRSASSKATSIVGSTGRPSIGNFRSDRKSKTKPKQKMNNLSTSGNGPLGRLMVATNPASASVCGSGQSVGNGSNLLSRERGLSSSINIPRDSSKDEEAVDFANLQLNEFEELGVSNGIGGNQDLSSWLNFDEDNLQDHDSVGLEIPPDDLSDLHMFM